jgi:hypothetical protein
LSNATDGFFEANERNREFGSPNDRFRKALPHSGFWLMAAGIFDESFARLPTFQRVDEQLI